VTRCVLKKVAHKVAHSIFCENEDITFTVEKASKLLHPKNVIFTKIPKVVSHSMGENSPNLVTRLLIIYAETTESLRGA
jgi:hypothetical protein